VREERLDRGMDLLIGGITNVQIDKLISWWVDG